MERFNYKKRYGQNFLKNIMIVEKIVNIAPLTKNDLVVEVGPGKGVLTEQLASKAGFVLAYEIDKELELDLEKIMKKNNNVSVIYEDFISRNIEDDIKKYSYDNIYFVSNVPYYITTPILMKLMNCDVNFSKIVMMVQKEVGERFSAKCGTRAYGAITVYLNYFYEIKNEFKVGKEEFFPVPNVDSVIVSFTSKEEKLNLNNEDTFFKLVKDSFQFKRKTIKNNLRNYDLGIIKNILESKGYSLSSRAEQLPLEIYVELANSLK